MTEVTTNGDADSGGQASGPRGLLLGSVGGETAYRPGTRCRHRSYAVCEDGRRVECRSCGAVLDPFDVLLEYARAEREFANWRGRAAEHAGRVRELEEEERRVKARTMRAHRKDAEAATAAERKKWVKRLKRARWGILQVIGDAEKALRALPEDGTEKRRGATAATATGNYTTYEHDRRPRCSSCNGLMESDAPPICRDVEP